MVGEESGRVKIERPLLFRIATGAQVLAFNLIVDSFNVPLIRKAVGLRIHNHYLA